jgi:hypothetical protein
MKKLLLLSVVVLFSISIHAQVAVISQTNAGCSGGCSGAVTLSVTGGISPYNLMIQNSNGSCVPSSSIVPFAGPTITIYSLCPCASSYSFLVFDSGASLVGTAGAMITAASGPVAVLQTTNVCCFGSCTGAINPIITAGTPPYTTTLVSSMGSMFPPYINLCAGNYTLNVMDNAGCTTTKTTTISQNAQLNVGYSLTAASCATCCNGSITSFATGGTSAYTYTISPPGITSYSTGGLCPGNYTVCVKDGCGCLSCTVAIVPNGATGISNHEITGTKIEVFPNPSNGNFKIQSSNDLTQFGYEVFDLVGNKILTGKAEEEIHLKDASDGVYILGLLKADGTVVTRKKITVTR